jgi:hypothetical protein
MAASKRIRSLKSGSRQFTRFPEVKGKIVESVEVDPDVQAVVILFKDRTALSFDFDPSLTVFPELSDWKTGNWKGIKRWAALHSKISMLKWP